ncbi:hypothetical protein E3N88_21695 [Mikania micrantha]|uniref:Reverse transcriptase Ty1/copia-type domain-containing protein n=1 Tax=Mikania micrantha TaxID=192012 RepID=A0A5N6N8Q1_9ASTR|nr:hypothetical protein E3N88_21695 [Mikania micrantha]
MEAPPPVRRPTTPLAVGAVGEIVVVVVVVSLIPGALLITEEVLHSFHGHQIKTLCTGRVIGVALAIFLPNAQTGIHQLFVQDNLSLTLLISGNNDRAIDQVVKRLGATFSLQDMGPLSYFLGVEVVRQGSDIILSQRKYIQDILARANLLSAKPVPSPCTTTSSLSLGDSPAFSDPVRYRQLVGALQYVTLSRPDISFAVNKVCQFMHSPTENHWSAVKRILRFLLGTINHGLLISHSSQIHLHAYADSHNSYIQAFSDADWAGCPDDRRSTGDMPSISGII